MNRTIIRCWHWSWIITLPITLVFTYWSVATIENFYTFGIRYNSAPIEHKLHLVGRREFFNLYRKAELLIPNASSLSGPEADDLKVINLFVSKSNLAKLNSNLPHSDMIMLRAVYGMAAVCKKFNTNIVVTSSIIGANTRSLCE